MSRISTPRCCFIIPKKHMEQRCQRHSAYTVVVLPTAVSTCSTLTTPVSRWWHQQDQCQSSPFSSCGYKFVSGSVIVCNSTLEDRRNNLNKNNNKNNYNTSTRRLLDCENDTSGKNNNNNTNTHHHPPTPPISSLTRDSLLSKVQLLDLTRFLETNDNENTENSTTHPALQQRFPSAGNRLNFFTSSPFIRSSPSSPIARSKFASLTAPLVISSTRASSSSTFLASEMNKSTTLKVSTEFEMYEQEVVSALKQRTIASCIFKNQSETVGSLLPNDFFSPQNLVDAGCIASVTDLYRNKDGIRDFLVQLKSMSALDVFNIAGGKVPSQYSQQFKQHSNTIANLQFHPAISRFMQHQYRIAELHEQNIVSLFDWIKNKEDATRTRSSDETDSELAKQAVRVLNALDYPRRNVTPGYSHRHTTPFGFGALARDDAFEAIGKIFSSFAKEKERLPLLIIRSMPRQGKTRIGDELGYRKHCYQQLKGATAKNTIIFNVTLSTKWVEKHPYARGVISESAMKSFRVNKKTVDEVTSTMLNLGREQDEINELLTKMIRVEHELCRRVVGAAIGVYTSGQFYSSPFRSICDTFIEAYDHNFSAVVRELVSQERKQGHANFVFVFDEITNLEEHLHDRSSSLLDSKLKEHFYSIVTSIIELNSAVLVSGFSEARKAVSASGRPLKTIGLKPISKVHLRRELHTMKTKFFGLFSTAGGRFWSQALFHYELVKSAPGLLGTLIELRRENPTTSLLTILEQGNIPILVRLANDPEGLTSKSMLAVLQLKSLLFFCDAPEQQEREEQEEPTSESNAITFSDFCRDVIFNTLEFALKEKVVDASASKFNIAAALSTLYQARLEPLFLNRVGGDLAKCMLSDYWNLLHKFSNIAARVDFHGKLALVDRSDVLSHFSGSVEEQERIKTALERHDLEWSKRYEKRQQSVRPSNLKENNISILEQTIDNNNELKIVEMDLKMLCGYFLEDAIALGLLLQRQLRRQLMERPIDDSGSKFYDISNNSISANNNDENHRLLYFNHFEPNPSCSLDQYLDGSEVVISIQEDSEFAHDGANSVRAATGLRGNICRTFPRGRILWSRKPASSSSPRSSSSMNDIIRFEGHFPCQQPKKQLQESHQQKQQQQQRYRQFESKENNVSSSQYKSLEHVLVPRRIDKYGDPENNPLVDVIINERFSEDYTSPKKNEVIQFWIDAKHHNKDSKEAFTKHEEPSSKTRIIPNLRLGLEEIARLANEESEKQSQIRHVVYIVVGPFRQNDNTHKDSVESLYGDIRDQISLPHPLKCFTLCFVSPDDLSEKKAFENLVSQPIALTVPLIEQQMQQSWTHRLPSPKKWWGYNATEGCRSRVKRRFDQKNEWLMQDNNDLRLHAWCPVSSRMKSIIEFRQWRKIRFNNDCAMGIGHLFSSREKALKGDPSKEPQFNTKLVFTGGDNKWRTSSEGLEIPFGCILEAVGILPRRVHGTRYCQFDDRKFRYELCLISDADDERVLTTNGAKAEFVHFEILTIGNVVKPVAPWYLTVHRHWLMTQIRVGHLVRCAEDDDVDDDGAAEDRTDVTCDDTITTMFNQKRAQVPTRCAEMAAFLDPDYPEKKKASDMWSGKFEKYHHAKKNEGANSSGELPLKSQKTMLTCSEFWNLSLYGFEQIMFNETYNNPIRNQQCVIEKGSTLATVLQKDKEAFFDDYMNPLLLVSPTAKINADERRAIVRKLAKYVREKINDRDFDCSTW